MDRFTSSSKRRLDTKEQINAHYVSSSNRLNNDENDIDDNNDNYCVEIIITMTIKITLLILLLILTTII